MTDLNHIACRGFILDFYALRMQIRLFVRMSHSGNYRFVDYTGLAN